MKKELPITLKILVFILCIPVCILLLPLVIGSFVVGVFYEIAGFIMGKA